MEDELQDKVLFMENIKSKCVDRWGKQGDLLKYGTPWGHINTWSRENTEDAKKELRFTEMVSTKTKY